MGGSPCNTASLYVPPIAWGATSAAPDNSTRDRNVDWKCTFTWPGLAPVASAMVVELLVDLLYHPLGADTPYPTPSRRGGRGAAAEVVTFSPDLGGGGGGRVHGIIAAGICPSPDTGVACLLHHGYACRPHLSVMHWLLRCGG